MKKRITAIAISVFMVSAAVCLTACKKNEPRDITLYVTISNKSNEMDTEWNELGSYELKHFFGYEDSINISVERCDSIIVTAVAKYDDTGEYVPEKCITEKFEDTLHSDSFNSLMPGSYHMEQNYKGFDRGGGVAFFNLNIEILENRPLPEIVYEGKEAIGREGDDVKEGIKFIYKYDGKQHCPAAKLICEGKSFMEFSSAEMMGNGQRLFNPKIYDGEKFVDYDKGLLEWATDVGLYKFDFIVGRASLPEDYEELFCEINVPLYIEIAE